MQYINNKHKFRIGYSTKCGSKLISNWAIAQEHAESKDDIKYYRTPYLHAKKVRPLLKGHVFYDTPDAHHIGFYSYGVIRQPLDRLTAYLATHCKRDKNGQIYYTRILRKGREIKQDTVAKAVQYVCDCVNDESAKHNRHYAKQIVSVREHNEMYALADVTTMLRNIEKKYGLLPVVDHLNELKERWKKHAVRKPSDLTDEDLIPCRLHDFVNRTYSEDYELCKKHGVQYWYYPKYNR